MGKGKARKRRLANELSARSGLLKRGKVGRCHRLCKDTVQEAAASASVRFAKPWKARAFCQRAFCVPVPHKRLLCSGRLQARQSANPLPPPPSKKDVVNYMPKSLRRLLAAKVGQSNSEQAHHCSCSALVAFATDYLVSSGKAALVTVLTGSKGTKQAATGRHTACARREKERGRLCCGQRAAAAGQSINRRYDESTCVSTTTGCRRRRRRFSGCGWGAR